MSTITLAGEIREYVLVAVIKPARRRGDKSVSFTANAIHKGMGLPGNYMPDVCSSIDAQKFLKYAGAILMQRSGPGQSTTAKWAFSI